MVCRGFKERVQKGRFYENVLQGYMNQDLLSSWEILFIYNKPTWILTDYSA